MQHSLSDHIAHLEELIRDLDDRLSGPQQSEAERLRVFAELRTAQLALLHYRQAYVLETAVRA